MSNPNIGKILVVDDEVELMKILIQALAEQGYETVGFTSGEAALKALGDTVFDLMLTDLMMQGMDGIALVREGMKLDLNLICVMMTGQGTIQTAVDAMKVGAFDYVLKPFRLQTMLPVLTRAMNMRHVRLENVQLREAVAIHELSETIAFTLDRQTVLSKLADGALSQSGADEVSILLPDKNELYVAAVRGTKRERLLGERVPLQEGISSWVARERMPLILNGHVADDRFVALWPRSEIRSAVSIPMQVANKLVGVINLNMTDRLRPFTLGQMKALTILAGTAAAALESASLFAKVQQAEQNYRSIFENAVEGIFRCSEARRFLTVNPSLAEMLGYGSPEEVLDSFTDIGQQLYVRPEQSLEVTRTLETAGVVHGFEFEAYRKDGEKIWLSLNLRPVRDQTGAEVYREGTFEDITERRRAEAERRLMFEIIQGVVTTPTLDELLKLIHTSISRLLDAENCFVALHDPTTNLLHYEFWADKYDPVPPSRPLGTGFSSYVIRTNQSLLLTRKRIQEMEAQGDVIPSGKPAQSWLGVPLRTAGGTIGALVLQHYETDGAYTERDLELLASVGDQVALAIERKRAEDALEESEKRKDAILRTALDCVVTIDHEGKVIDFNPAAESTFGYASSEVIGKTMADMIVPPHLRTSLEAGFNRYIETGRTSMLGKRLEVQAMRADGSEIPIELTITAIGEHPHPKFTAFMRDLTERKRAEAEQARLNSEVKHQTDRLNTIVATVPGVVFEVTGTAGAGDNKTVFVNEYIGPMLGYTVSEWLAVPGFWLSIVHPDDRQRVGQEAAVEFAEGREGAHEFRWLKKDGGILWVRAHTIVVLDEDGKPAGVRGVVTDITERKHVEEMQARREIHALFRADVGAALAVSRATLQVTLNSCTDAMVKHLHAAFARVWTLNREDNILELQASSGLYTHIDGPHARVPVGKFTIGRIAQERAPHITNDVQTDPGVSDQEWARQQKMVAFAGYPLVVADRLLGVMALFSREPLTEDTLEAMASVADVISQGIERKRAEQELSKSEERYRDLVENAQDIIYSHDLKGNYLSSNQAGEEITGYTLAESLRLNLSQTVAPEYLEKARKMLQRKLAGENVTAYELELIAKDGHRVPVEVNTRLVLEKGVPVAVTGVARDITERKRAEAELRRLAAAVEETADSIVITDAEGNIQYVNPSFERVTGYTKEEVLGQNPRLLKSGKTNPEIYKQLWETITAGDSWTGHLINRRKDGTFFEERVTISALYDEAHEIINYVAVKQDVSDLILLEEQLRQSQKMEAIGQLAGGVAHDFNNLLTAINGYSSLALQRMEGDSIIKGYLEEIKKAGDRAANLTRQLLAFGRKQMLQPLALNLNDVIGDMNKMLRRLIGEDIQLTAKFDPSLQKTKADPGQIEQVLVNLVVNARDAMPTGGKLTIETTNGDLEQEYASKHVGVQPGKYVILAVSDTGSGMDSETKARIFEPFFTTKEIGKGTGLGLSTVYGIVKQSGGNIWVYSEPGRGTTFKVYLPQIEGHTEPEAKPVVPSAALGGTETILLVEDEDVVRGLARKILESVGYNVLDANSGQEAFRLCEVHPEPIHLLLTDVVMPRTSGREVAEHLTLLRPGLRVLFMSGYTDEAIVHHGILDSSVEFIQKPFNPGALIRKVREVLDGQAVAV
ncbi:MAG: two-component system, cell cycle sensor histidine kinase and response regulator CckA [Blastocatellia bacterium]|nr:two-component system, cell cycle sensor histidine kinase and response regulator CckA [Blastocatellia bacterium]